MRKKKEVIDVMLDDVKSSISESVEKVKPSKIEFNFGNGDLNLLKDKINEVIDSI